MGLSSSKQTTKTSENRTENSTQTPLTPGYLEDAARDYVGRIATFGNMDPNQFVAPASPLQQQAWGKASSLFAGSSNGVAPAGVGGKPRNPGPMAQWIPPGEPSGQGGFGGAMDMASRAGDAPANLGTAQGYAAPRIGSPIGATTQGYAAERVGQPILAQGGSAADNMARYRNPYEQDVVNTTLADFDQNAGQVRAAQAANGARNGAFGGSRFGIREAQTEGELARGRASADANIRAQGFNTAAQFGGMDADRAQQASMFNANAGNSASLANAGFQNEANRYGADAANQASLFNTGQQNDFMRTQAGLDQSAGQFNAGAQNQMSMFNAGQQDNSLARQLQAAGLMGDLTNSQMGNDRSDIALLSQLGDQQRDVEAAYRTAPLSQLQAIGQLSGMTPYDILVGRQNSGTMTGTGTQTTRSSPSMFNQAIGLGSLFL